MSGGEFPKRDLMYLDLGEIVLADDHDVTVAIMNRGTAAFSADEIEALGELMAAAPDMYEALVLAKTALLSAKPIMAHYPEPNDRHKAAFEAVEAALVRASSKEA